MEDYDIAELEHWLNEKKADMGAVKDAVRAMSNILDRIAKIMKGCNLPAHSDAWWAIVSLVEATGRDCG